MAGLWTTFTLKRTGLALVASLLIAPLFALVTKALVEGFTDTTYEIHWFETVPSIILLFTLVRNRLLNEHHARREEGESATQG